MSLKFFKNVSFIEKCLLVSTAIIGFIGLGFLFATILKLINGGAPPAMSVEGLLLYTNIILGLLLQVTCVNTIFTWQLIEFNIKKKS